MVVAESLPRLTMVSGPASAGKSRWAEHLALDSGHPVIYVATGPDLPDDADWQQRLHRHRQRRPAAWPIWEVGGELNAALIRLESDQLALVDSLGTWVAAHLEHEASDWQLILDELVAVIRSGTGRVVMVAEECGWGVVPATALGGCFRERLGVAQQRLSAQAGASWLVVQGRALPLHELSRLVPGDT